MLQHQPFRRNSLIDGLCAVLRNKTGRQSSRYKERIYEVVNLRFVCVREEINEISLSLKHIDNAYNGQPKNIVFYKIRLTERSLCGKIFIVKGI